MAKKRSQSKAAMARAVARGRQQAEAQAAAGASTTEDMSQAVAAQDDAVSDYVAETLGSDAGVEPASAQAETVASSNEASDDAQSHASASDAAVSEQATPEVDAAGSDAQADHPAEMLASEPVQAESGTGASPTEDDNAAQAPTRAPSVAETPAVSQASPVAAPPSQEESAFAAAQPEEGSIRGVLIQVAGGRLLLPNATIAEVLSYAQPEAIENAPDWLLGRMRWRGWQLPMIAFSQLAGIGAERAGLGTKVVVLKALGRNSRLPYFALVTQGFPRLVTVTEQTLMLDAGEGEELPRGIQARVRLNQDDALLPDLETVEGLIGDAMAQAA